MFNRSILLLVFSFIIGIGIAYADAIINIKVTSQPGLTAIDYEPIRFGNIMIDSNRGAVRLDRYMCSVTWNGGIVSVDQTDSQCGSISFTAPRPGNVKIICPEKVAINNTMTGSEVIFRPEMETQKEIEGYNQPVKIKIGGLLEFKTDTIEGSYIGNFNVTVDYVPMPDMP